MPEVDKKDKDRKLKRGGVSVSMQKVTFGKAGIGTVKVLAGDEAGHLLEELQQLVFLQTDKTRAEKITKNLIKIVFKVTILIRNKQFDKDEMDKLMQIRTRLKTLILSITSFYEVPYSYEAEYLQTHFNGLRDALKVLLLSHLKPKSIARVDDICTYFGDPKVMETALGSTAGPIHSKMGDVVTIFNKLLAEKII